MSQFIEMSNSWNKVELGKYIDIIRGVSYKPNDLVEGDDANAIGILRANNIYNGLLNTDEMVYVTKERVSEIQKIQLNDIVICASSGSQNLVGKAAINKTLSIQYSHGAFCLLVRCKDSINPDYLNLFLQTTEYRNQIEEKSCGSNILNIKPSHISTLTIPMPNEHEQSKFVEIIQQADKSKFVGFKSQFIEMFGNCKIHDILSSLCNTFIDGDWIESKDQSEEGIRLIQTGNIGSGFFKDKDDKSRYISEETFKKLNCTEVLPGDILVSRLPDPIGRACIVPADIGKAITAVDCTIVRLKETLLPEFFISFSKTALYESQINKLKTGTTRLRVSRGNLAKIRIPVPPIKAQKSFSSIAQQADKSKYIN